MMQFFFIAAMIAGVVGIGAFVILLLSEFFGEIFK